MATRTTSQAGDWSNSATWGGNPVPGDTDRAVVNHAVAVDVTTTVGRSGPGSPAAAPIVAAAGGGSLAAGTYYVRYTSVDANGIESLSSPETGGTAINGTSETSYNVTLPALPTGVSSYRIYASLSGGYFLQASGVGAGVTAITTHATVTGYAAVYDLEVNAALTVEPGVTLVVRGNALQHGNGADVTQQAGSTVEVDASASGSTAATTYKWVVGDSSVSANARYTTQGSAGSRCAIRSNAGGGNFSFDTTSNYNGGLHDWAYTDVTRLGTASSPAVRSVSLADPNALLSFDHCVFDTCGDITASGNVVADVPLTFTDNYWTGTVGSACLSLTTMTNPTASRVFTGNCFDKTPVLPIPNATVSGNFFFLALGFNQGFGKATAMAGNFIRKVGLDSMPRYGDWSGSVMVADGSTYAGGGTYSATADLFNPHWTAPFGVADGTFAVVDCVFEDFGSAGDGDVDYGPTTGCDSAFLRCIGISQSGGNPGTLATLNGWNGCASTYDHCTWETSQTGAIAVGESSAGFEGMLASMRSNILFRRSASAGVYKVTEISPLSEPIAVAIAEGANVDYNCGFNINTTGGAAGNGYDGVYDGTPGVNDVDVDPQFVDWTRNFSTWVASVEVAWTGEPTPSRTDYNARGLYKLSLHMSGQTGHADYDARYTLAAYLTHVRGGFAPTNPLLEDAGHDGITIGAVEGVWTPDVSVVVAETTIERGQAGQTLTVTMTGGTSSGAGDWAFAVGGSSGSVTAQTGSNPYTLTVTAPQTAGTATLTHTPSGATDTLTVSDTTNPASPTGVSAGTVSAYSVPVAFTLPAASPAGETVTATMRKNASVVATGQTSSPYLFTGVVDGDVLKVRSVDNAGNESADASVTFTAPTGGGSSGVLIVCGF